MNKKTIIHEFDPQIYPRLLWVVKGGELEEIRKTLEFGELGDDEQKGEAMKLLPYLFYKSYHNIHIVCDSSQSSTVGLNPIGSLSSVVSAGGIGGIGGVGGRGL